MSFAFQGNAKLREKKMRKTIRCNGLHTMDSFVFDLSVLISDV